MSVHAGSTLLLSPTHRTDPHLWIVLTDPEGSPPQVVMVNLTSLRPGMDETLVLRRGDHKFVRRDTAVLFSDARFANVEPIGEAIKKGIARRHEDATIDLLERVQAGLLESPETPSGIKRYCRDRF